MARQARNPHIGGEQMSLMMPESAWVAPTQLPDLPAMGVRLVAEDLECRDDGLALKRGPGWATRAGHVCGVAMSWQMGAKIESIYAPIAHPDTPGCFDKATVARWLKHVHEHCEVVYHNASYDCGWNRVEFGLNPPARVHDTIAAAVMVDENRLSYELDAVCEWQGVPGKDETLLREAVASLGWPGGVKSNIYRTPARYVGPYAQADTEGTLRAFLGLMPIIEEEGTGDAYRLEMDLVPLVLEMRLRGVRVNIEKAMAAKAHFLARRDAIFADLAERLGERVGMDEIGRNSWMERVFSAHKINYPRTAPTDRFPDGQASFTAGTTGWMHKHAHWLPQMLVKADKFNNAATKFCQGFIIDYAHRGRLHASINQYRNEEGGTRTHRFSYSNPALQQIPKRDPDIGPVVRDVFEPEVGEVWMKPDQSQQEYRLIVSFAESFKPPLDKSTDAGEKYRTDPDADFHNMVVEWTDLDRQSAKDTNFAKSYRTGVAHFAEMINKSEREAKAIYSRYDEELPFVRELAEKTESIALNRGFIKLIDGARIHFDRWEPRWKSDGAAYAALSLEAARARWPGQGLRRAFCYMAVNSLIQGSAARQTKRWMLGCWREGIVPLLQLHDELDASVIDPAVAQKIIKLGEEAVRLTVPSKVDAHYGPTWAKAKLSWNDAIKGLHGA